MRHLNRRAKVLTFHKFMKFLKDFGFKNTEIWVLNMSHLTIKIEKFVSMLKIHSHRTYDFKYYGMHKTQNFDLNCYIAIQCIPLNFQFFILFCRKSCQELNPFRSEKSTNRPND